MTLTNQQPYTGVQLAAPYCNRSTKNYTDEEKARIIKRVVSEYLHIRYKLLSDKTRKREVVEARQIAMDVMRQNTKLGVKGVGMQFGYRHWSTVIHATQTVSDLCETNKRFKSVYQNIINRVQLELLS